MPADTKMVSSSQTFGVLSDLESGRGVHILDASDGSDTEKFKVTKRLCLVDCCDRLSAVFGIGRAASNPGKFA